MGPDRWGCSPSPMWSTIISRLRFNADNPERPTHMPVLKTGEPAPEVALADDEGKQISLAAHGDKPIVLFFYPKDDTPGCTVECKEFRDARSRFLDKAHVFGISPDDAASHQAFRDKYALNFPLLSDPRHVVAGRFGVCGLKHSGDEG